MSHPTWVRGLKLAQISFSVPPEDVAPYVGAWIETNILVHLSCRHCVAPYVGAWIETILTLWYIKIQQSHPTWVRGLKLSQCDIPE